MTGWPIRGPIAKSEEDWNTGLPKCITSESSAGTVENQNGSDVIPGDEPVLALRNGTPRVSSAVTEADTHPAAFFCGCARSQIAVDEAASAPKTFAGTEIGMQPLYLARIEDRRGRRNLFSGPVSPGIPELKPFRPNVGRY